MELETVRSNWDAFGRTNPLWAILSSDESWDIDEFYATGRAEISAVLERLEELGLEPAGDALDFGCGAGRLTQALADRFASATGVDVAQSMIELAIEQNRQGDRCRFVLNEAADLSCFADGSFAFLYSNIVLQHVGTDLAKGYIAEFLRVASPGAILVFQVPSHLAPVRAVEPEDCRARITVHEPVTAPGSVLTVPAGVPIPLRMTVRNDSARRWEENDLIRLGLKWFRWEDYQLVLVDEGQRALLPGPVEPGEEVTIDIRADVPGDASRYTVLVDVVQENVAWFGDYGSPVARVSLLTQGASAGAAGTEGEGGSIPEDAPLIPRMEMHPVSRADVESIVRGGGGEMVAVLDDDAAGPHWISYLYVVRRLDDPGPAEDARGSAATVRSA